MAQYDVYANSDRRTRSFIPYFIDIQSDFLDDLETRLVMPLVPSGRRETPIPRLHPVVEIDGKLHHIVTQEMAAVPRQVLSGKPVANLSDRSYEIIAAVDFLVTGI